jgi:hypothetical protein
MSNATLACVAILAKTLSDKGVVTDAELLTRANAAIVPMVHSGKMSR